MSWVSLLSWGSSSSPEGVHQIRSLRSITKGTNDHHEADHISSGLPACTMAGKAEKEESLHEPDVDLVEDGKDITSVSAEWVRSTTD